MMFTRIAGMIFFMLAPHLHIVSLPEKRHEADISYCIADIKFDGKNVNICELGPCTSSQFAGYEYLYGRGAIWGAIWDHLSSFRIPMWYVCPTDIAKVDTTETNFNAFQQHGGKIVLSLRMLSNILKARPKHYVYNPNKIGDYQGIVILYYKHHQQQANEIKTFIEHNPSILVMNAATAPHVKNKIKTNTLFSDPELAPIKPAWRLCSKELHHRVMDELDSSFNHPMYVIKPPDQSKGKGVIVATREQLPETLGLILEQPTLLLDAHDPSYAYWGNAPSDDFLIEAYAPSKPIIVDHCQYDATMRVVFALAYNRKKITVDILGCYWKLPVHPLDAPCSFTDKHKSNISTNHVSSAIVSDDDQKQVAGILKHYLPMVYKKML